jgi:ABC-2 type transport system ATP-binding protein
MAKFYANFYTTFDWSIYDELVEGFALPENKRISTFSKGMKRQAAFLLGMAVKPQYIMLDECFDGLDPVKRQIVRKVLCDAVADRQMTAVISSHNLKELDEICDTVGILHKGQLLYSKDLDDLKGEVHKVQVVFTEEVEKTQLEKLLPVMAMDVRGKFYTLIVRGSMEEIEEKLSPFRPAALEAVPLTLEEVFLYEMEVMGYDANIIFRD